jgi:hypothetical protein
MIKFKCHQLVLLPNICFDTQWQGWELPYITSSNFGHRVPTLRLSFSTFVTLCVILLLPMSILLLHDMYVSCHRHFFLVLLLNQRWSPPLTLQASHCSTFRIMCDVPSIAVFCSASIECFPIWASRYYSSSSNYYRYNRTFQVPYSLYLYT